MFGIDNLFFSLLFRIGEAFTNNRNKKKNLEEIKKYKQKEQEDIQEHKLKRDYEKFKKSCELQRQMEADSYEEKLKEIEADFEDWVKKASHNEMLRSHYPLSISPYVVKSTVMPFYNSPIGEKHKEVFCLLTHSNSKVFNDCIVPVLDDFLCNAISLIWNEKSMHILCYYTNVWKQNRLYCDDDIENLKTIIKVPTITVTPFFDRKRNGYDLIVKLNVWGDGIDQSINLATGISYDLIPTTYSTSEMGNVISLLFPIIMCEIGQIVDVYYWTNNYQPPILPSVLAKKLVKVDDETCEVYGKVYMKLFETLVLGNVESNSVCVLDSSLLKDVSDINLYNFPERVVGFLEALTKIPQIQQYSGDIILKTLSSLYEAVTDSKFESIENMDVKLLDRKYMDQISKMIDIAKESNNDALAKQLIEIVSRKILSWD